MTTATFDREIKHLRELLPENGKNIPDEFIKEILDVCSHDLTSSFELLQERLARATWEVETGRKKKRDSKVKESFKDRRPRAPYQSSSSKSDSRGSFGNQAIHGRTKNSPNTSQARPQKVELEFKPQAVRSAVSTPVVENKPVDFAPSPCNQWAKGRPRIIVCEERNTQAVVESKSSVCLDIPVNLHNMSMEDLPNQQGQLSDKESLDTSSHSGDTLPHQSPEFVSIEIDNEKSTTVPLLETPCAEETNQTVDDPAGSSGVTDISATVTNFDQLALSEGTVPQQSQSNIVEPKENCGNIENSAQAQAVFGSNLSVGEYSECAQYPQQYNSYQPRQHAAAKNFFAGADGFSGDAGSAARQFQNKSQHFPQHQQFQGYGWPSTMGGTCGMMAPNMYSMTPQQLQMMCMQTYGMGMPFSSNFSAGMGLPYSPQSFSNAAKPNQFYQTGQQKKAQYSGVPYSQSNAPGYPQSNAGFQPGGYVQQPSSAPFGQTHLNGFIQNGVSAGCYANGGVFNVAGFPQGRHERQCVDGFDGCLGYSSMSMPCDMSSQAQGYGGRTASGPNSSAEDMQFYVRNQFFGQPENCQAQQSQ